MYARSLSLFLLLPSFFPSYLFPSFFFLLFFFFFLSWGCDLKAVGHVDVEALANVLGVAGLLLVGGARALADHKLVAALVQHGAAHLALVALLAQAPHELAAMRAKRGLPEEASDKLVRIDLIVFVVCFGRVVERRKTKQRRYSEQDRAAVSKCNK